MNDSPIFKQYEKYKCWRGDKQRILKNSIGRQLPYIVNFDKNQCKVFDIELERVTHWFSFPEGCKLVDVDYFPTPEGHLGVLVGVHDVRKTWSVENFVVALSTSPEEPLMRVTHSLELPAKITVVKTLFSHSDMRHDAGLYHRLLEWKHIVAIGCKQSKCFLTQLSAVNPTTTVPISEAKRGMMNLLNAFTKDGVLSYALSDGCYREYLVESVYVSALALMPRSRTLLVGLSMGGILAASLNPSNNMVLLELHHERLIRQIAPLEPEDDPDKFEYFITAVDRSSRHTVMMQLWRGSFKTANEVDESAKYDRPMYGVCLQHKMAFGERWLAVNPIVRERGDPSSNRRRDDTTLDSTLNASQTFGSALDRSQVLLAYERRKPGLTSSSDDVMFVVEAAIFDIDAWYYKRVPERVTTDGTVLRQCAFMSCISSDISSEDVNDIGVLTLDTDDVSRFRSMVSDADQLFYPSALSYDRVFVAGVNEILWMKIQNIQATILETCASKLPIVIRSPETMSSHLLAAGLVRKSILSGSPNSSAVEYHESDLTIDQKVVLNAIVHYEKSDELCSLATRRELNDRFKSEIGEWAVHEAIDFKRTIADRTASVFEGSSTALSPLACDTITQGIKLFGVVYEYLKVCSKQVKNGVRLNSLAQSLRCMRNHTKLVKQFIGFHMVPANCRIQQKMREMHEKRKGTAMKNRTALPVQLVVRNMHRLAPESRFWNELPHDEWYPPTPIDVLEPLLNVSIPERLKRELIVQYIVDHLRASPENADLDTKTLALRTISVMTNHVLDVDLAKILYVLDQETCALTTKTPVENVVGAKVFSLQDDGVSYDKLFGGDVHLATIGKKDLERFEERLKAQTEEVGKRKLTILDPESEKMYQVFLYERQKYQLMSSEAIEAIKQNAKIPFGLLLKTNGARHDTKTAQQRKIETSVKSMFERQLRNESTADEVPEVFASLAGASRKRKSDVFEEETENGGSPVIYVPPTAKRIQQKPRESPVREPSSPTDAATDAEMNQMMATPARFYKRPTTTTTTNVMSVDMLSPTVHRLPPVSTQNSILKTAKTAQSPSRGRIRFHESVRRAADESTEERQDEEEEEEVEEVPVRRGINFNLLEDVDEENDEDVSRKSLISAKINRTEEETFEVRSDDVAPPSDETFELSQAERTFETQDEVFEVLEDVQKPVELEIQLEQQEEVQEESQELVQLEELQEEPQETNQPEIQMEQQQEVQEESQKTIQLEEHQEELQASIQPEGQMEEVQDDVEEPWDGIHRSFEAQKDEEDPAEEVAIQIDQECADETVPDYDRPPSANTRSASALRAAKSRSVTPTEQESVEKTSEVLVAAEEVKKTPKRARAASVKKDVEPEILEEEDEEEVVPTTSTRPRRASVSRSRATSEVVEEKKTPRKTRAPSVKKDLEPEILEEEVPTTTTRPRKASVSRSRATSEVVEEKKTPRKTRAPSVKKDAEPEILEEDEEEVVPTTVTRPRRASVSRSRANSEVVEDKKTPRKTRAPSVKEDLEPELQDEEVPTTLTRPRRASVSRSRATSEVVEEKKTPRKTRAPSVKKDAEPEIQEEDVPTTSTRPRRASVSRSRATSEVVEEKKTPKKTARGRKASESVSPTEPIVFPPATGSAIARRISAKRAQSVIATPEVAPAESSTRAISLEPDTPKTTRGRPKKNAEEASTSTKRRTPSVPDDAEEPPKKARGRPRTTPLKVIPESEDEKKVETSTPRRAASSRSRNNSTSSNTTTTTPKRGRKAVLEDVEEENDEEPEQTPSLRRSARRLQQQ